MLKCITTTELKLQNAQYYLRGMKATKDNSSALDFLCEHQRKSSSPFGMPNKFFESHHATIPISLPLRQLYAFILAQQLYGSTNFHRVLGIGVRPDFTKVLLSF
jgi:hypothetical protein